MSINQMEYSMSLEQEIKEFVNSLGIDVVGVAGPGRFDGPPSLDPNYILKGGKSVITFAIPFDVPPAKNALPPFSSPDAAMPRMMGMPMRWVYGITAADSWTKSSP